MSQYLIDFVHFKVSVSFFQSHGPNSNIPRIDVNNVVVFYLNLTIIKLIDFILVHSIFAEYVCYRFTIIVIIYKIIITRIANSMQKFDYCGGACVGQIKGNVSS